MINNEDKEMDAELVGSNDNSLFYKKIITILCQKD